MCGCFRINPQNREMAAFLGLLPPDSPPVKTGDIYPTDIAAICCWHDGRMAVRAMAWGFPAWYGKGVIFNARSETALEKPMFGKALRQRRGVVPANGFYEWWSRPGERKKEKLLFTHGPILYLAAIWGFFERDQTLMPQRFTLLTTRANASMLPYHQRMPLLLAKHECRQWLAGPDPTPFLRQAPEAVALEPAL